MSDRKFTVWLDSGANVHSCRTTEVTLDDLGLTSEEWDKMADDQKDEEMKEIAFDRADWGWREE